MAIRRTKNQDVVANIARTPSNSFAHFLLGRAAQSGDLIVLLISTGLCGCVVSAPKYPNAWSPLQTGNVNCIDVSGTYENLGQSKGVDAVGPPKLDRLLFPPFEGENFVSTVRLKTAGASLEAVATLSDGTTRDLAIGDNGTCTALQRPVRGPNGARGINDGGVIGVSRKTFVLYRAQDGALVIRSIEKGSNVWLLIPIGIDVQYWYRFPERVPVTP